MNKHNYFQDASKIIDGFTNYFSDSDEECTCNHELIDVNGIMTCKLCGVMISGKFVNEIEIVPKEIRILESKKYSKIKHLKKKLIAHSMRTIEVTEQYKNLYYTLIKSLPPKFIKSVLKDSTINAKDFYSFLLDSEKERLKKSQIDIIFEICDRFIKLKLIKNINNKALIFVIAKKEFGINLFSYTGAINKSVIEKYEILYSDFCKK